MRSLQERLVSHAQYRKAETINLLATSLISGDFHKDTSDVAHKILLLLYQTSDSPLNAVFQPSEASQQLLLELKGGTSPNETASHMLFRHHAIPLSPRALYCILIRVAHFQEVDKLLFWKKLHESLINCCVLRNMFHSAHSQGNLSLA